MADYRSCRSQFHYNCRGAKGHRENDQSFNAFIIYCCYYVISGLLLYRSSKRSRVFIQTGFYQAYQRSCYHSFRSGLFKLSVGMGTMVTYGSYFDKTQNLPGTAVKVALSDILVSMMAGLAIFPAVLLLALNRMQAQDCYLLRFLWFLVKCP